MEPDKRITALLEKYWQAETDEAEEAELKHWFAQNPGLSDHPAADLFNYFSEQQQITIPDGFDEGVKSPITRKTHLIKWVIPWMKVAAVVLIISSIVYISIFSPKPKPVILSDKDTYDDPQKAYLETKKALMLISHSLSTGTNYMSEIGKINTAEQLINSKSNKR